MSPDPIKKEEAHRFCTATDHRSGKDRTLVKKLPGLENKLAFVKKFLWLMGRYETEKG